MYVEIFDGLLTAAKIYEERRGISASLRNWRRDLLQRKARVGVFGAGGTGKSTLGLFLSGKLDYDRAPEDYRETLAIEHIKMAGDVRALLCVAPGQTRRQPSNIKSVFEEISDKTTTHIINVCAWGYHSSGLERKAHRMHDPLITDEEFRIKYFQDSKEVEISQLQNIAPYIVNCPGKVKMLTLVTKQDLWWASKDDVKSFYTSGQYNDCIGNIEQQKGAMNFSHELFSCALIEQNLQMADGFRLSNTTAGYDDRLRVGHLRIVSSAIEQIIRI